MSYILDALKKAERERHLAKVPTVSTLHHPTRDRRRPVWIWIAVVAALANTAVLVWLLRPETGREKEPASSAAPTPSSPVVPKATGVRADPPIIARQPDKAVPENVPPTEPVSQRPTTTQSPSSAQAPPVAQPPRVAQAPPVAQQPPRTVTAPEPTPKRLETKSAPSAPVAPPAPSPETTRPKIAAPPPAPAVAEKAGPPPAAPRVAAVPEKPAPAPPQGVTGTTPAERSAGPLPALQDLTAAEQGALPKMSLQVLVYSEVPAERMIFINNQKYVEGQSVEGKAVVESILPDGAVLSYQGKRFKLRH